MKSNTKVKYTPMIPQAPRDMNYHYIRDDGSFGIKLNAKLIRSVEELKEFAKLCEGKEIAADTETTGLSYSADHIIGFSVSLDGYSGIYCPIRHEIKTTVKYKDFVYNEDGSYALTKVGRKRVKTYEKNTFEPNPKNLPAKECLDIFFNDILKKSKITYWYNSEFDLNMIKAEGYPVMETHSFDTLILPYLYDANNKFNGLKAMSKLVLGRYAPTFKETLGDQDVLTYVDPEDCYLYAASDSANTFQLQKVMYAKVKKLLAKTDKVLSFDGKPFNVIKNDNLFIRSFVDYYGHCAQKINKEAARKYKVKIEEDLKTVSTEIYQFFNKGVFSLSVGSKEFKNTMKEFHIVTGALTDTGAVSYGKKGLKAFNRNMRDLKYIISVFDKVKFNKGVVNKRGCIEAMRFFDIMQLHGHPYFDMSLTENTIKFKDKRGTLYKEEGEFVFALEKLLESETAKLNILKKIQELSSLNKALNSYIDKLCNIDSAILKYKLMGTTSGRLASGNSKAKKENNSYYVNLNAQNLSKPHPQIYRADQKFADKHILGWNFEPVPDDFYRENEDNKEYYFVEGASQDLNIRSCIDAPEGRYIMSQDYSGQEVRTIASLANDGAMKEVFIKADRGDEDAVDIHTATAYKIWGKENYNKSLRKKAKACVFATNYGGNEHTIAESLEIPVKEAKEILDGYNKVYHEMVQWKRNEVEKMYRNQGRVFSIFGRPRQFGSMLKTAGQLMSEDSYKSESLVRAVERRVPSHLVQSCCGDILRVVMLKLYKQYFKNRNPHIDFYSTIHDEINFSIDKEYLVQYAREIQDIMKFDKLDREVSIVTSIDIGNSFGSCFPFEWANKERTILIPERN